MPDPENATKFKEKAKEFVKKVAVVPSSSFPTSSSHYDKIRSDDDNH
jgi:hypothetical protein